MNSVYTYKGFSYTPEKDIEPNECCKIFHDVVTPEGKTISLGFSPYCTPTKENFEKWVDLGCPQKAFMSPNWDNKDIEKMWENQSNK